MLPFENKDPAKIPRGTPITNKNHSNSILDPKILDTLASTNSVI